MRRIEVVATIRDAYLFAITHLGGVIGLIWVPMVLATIMGFFSLQHYYNDFIDALASNNLTALGPSMLMMLGYLVAALLLYAVMFVAVVQLALGARAAPAVGHFAFGNLEWRMFRALLGFIGVILTLVLPAFVVADAVFKVAGAGLPPAAGPALMLLVFYGVVLLAMPRFFCSCPPSRWPKPHRCCAGPGCCPREISGACWRSCWRCSVPSFCVLPAWK